MLGDGGHSFPVTLTKEEDPSQQKIFAMSANQTARLMIGTLIGTLYAAYSILVSNYLLLP